MATKTKQKGIHEKMAEVVEKHGERSAVVKAIEAAILVFLGATMLVTFFVAQAVADAWVPCYDMHVAEAYSGAELP